MSRTQEYQTTYLVQHGTKCRTIKCALKYEVRLSHNQISADRTWCSIERRRAPWGNIEVRNFAHRDSISNTGPCAAERGAVLVLQEEKETGTGQLQLNWEQQDA